MAATIEPGFTDAANAFNATPTVPLQEAALRYKGIQLMENWAANQTTVRSLKEQLAAAQGVSQQLLELATEVAPGIVTQYLSADNAAALAWQNTLQANIDASVASQVAAILATFPSPFDE